MTGATGNVVAELSSAGYREKQWTNLAKADNSKKYLYERRWREPELVQELDDDASWQKVVTGVHVFHMASPFIVGISDDDAEEKLFIGDASVLIIIPSIAFLKVPEKQWTVSLSIQHWSRVLAKECTAWVCLNDKGAVPFALASLLV